MRRKVGHLCAICIIYRATYPREIFTPIKDETYPLVVWRGHYCFLGGNWTGKAGGDPNPRATVVREINEELQLFKPVQSTAELSDTALHRVPITYKVTGLDRSPTAEEEQTLADVRLALADAVIPFGDYVLTIPDQVFVAADPASVQPTQTALCSVFTAGLDEDAWQKLAKLQDTFGNVSCESESAILTVDEIVEKGIKGQAGQDRILQEFLIWKRVPGRVDLPLHDGPTVEWVGMPSESYRDYFDLYEVERVPANLAR